MILPSQGAAVPNITVTAKSQDTGAIKTAQSSDEGNFVLPFLQPGNYTVTTDAGQGFGTSTYENIKVTVGAKTTLEVSLSASGSVNVVDVNAEGQGVEGTRTSISSTVEERRVINLPTNGRNFLDFVTLTPGIVRDPTRSGDLAVGGQKGTLNSLQIDGTSSDNTFFGQSSGRTGSGRAPSQFSIDTVKEFQVNQNGFSAEFGRGAGAVINVVTKSGTNRFTGSAFEYFRDESLNARSPACQTATTEKAANMQGNVMRQDEIKQITAAQAKDAVIAKDTQLIDVRTAEEYAGGHAPKAVNMPLDALEKDLSRLDKDKPVYVICQIGRRSQKGSEILKKAGFNDIYNIRGGTSAWIDAGFPVDK